MQGRLTVVAAERGQTDEGYHRGTEEAKAVCLLSVPLWPGKTVRDLFFAEGWIVASSMVTFVAGREGGSPLCRFSSDVAPGEHQLWVGG